MNPEKPYLVTMPCIGNDEIGHIAVAQNSRLPFDIRRTYWTFFTPSAVARGHHAHRELKQLIFAVSGVIRITLEKPGGEKHEFVLDHPATGLYIPPMYWRTIHLSDGAVLLCLASDEFAESDYIRDYSHFKRLT